MLRRSEILFPKLLASNNFVYKRSSFARFYSENSSSEWQLITSNNNVTFLKKEYQFKTFKRAVTFLNEALVPVTKSLKHHPRIIIDYNKITVELTTHDQPFNNTVSSLDYDFAKELDMRFQDKNQS